MTDDATRRFAALAASQGVDLDRLVREAEPANGGWLTADDPIGMRVAQFQRKMMARASGEFHPHRLPPIDPRVEKWAKRLTDHLVAPRGEWNQYPWLYLFGGVGAGKTSQLYQIVNQLGLFLAHRGRPFKWYVITHREFEAETHWTEGDAKRAIDDFKDADFVGFDDIGAFSGQRFAVDCTARLIDHRYERRLPMVYTGNLLLNRDDKVREQEQRLGERIVVLSDLLDERSVSRVNAAMKIDMGTVDHRAKMGGVIR